MSFETVPLESLAAREPGAITDGPFGSNLTSAHYTTEGPQVVRLQNIGDGAYKRAEAHISQTHFESLGKHEVVGGDLLVASLGDNLPRACLMPAEIGPAIVKADCIRVRLSQEVDPRWVLYALQRPEARAWAKDQLHGVGRPRLGLKTIRRIPLPIVALAEQRRIVDILEDHISRLDTADTLLDRTVRRSASLVAHALSIASAGDRIPLGTIADIQGGIQKQPKRKPAHNVAPFLRVANVTASGLDLGDVHEIEVFAGDRDRYELMPGDLLVVEGNGSASQIGRASLWDGSIPGAVHQNHLIRVRPSKALIPAYLEAVWNSPQNRDTLTSISSSSSGLHTLSVGKLKALEIPVPSIERQASAIAQVDAIRDACSRLTSAASASRVRSVSLRRALLAAAFSGKLTGAASDFDVIEELAVTT